MQHFSAKSLAPCAGVPLPGGRLVPSGRMVMSQALMSASLIGLPSFGRFGARDAGGQSVSSEQRGGKRSYA